MLVITRLNTLPHHQIQMLYRAMIHPKVRVYELCYEGVTLDTRPLKDHARIHTSHVQVVLVLDGQWEMWRGSTRWAVGAGECFVGPVDQSAERRSGAPFRALCLDWRVETTTHTPRVHQLQPATIWPIVRQMGRRWTPDNAAECTREILAILKIAGIGPDVFGEETLSTHHGEEMHTFCDALGALMSRLEDSPMWCDVAQWQDISIRQLRRYMETFLAMHPKREANISLRHYLLHHRLHCGVAMLSKEALSIAQIASHLGYSSTSALNNAYRRVGLESPSALRRALLALN